MSCSILNQSWVNHSKFYFPEEQILLNIDNNPMLKLKTRLLHSSSVNISISVLHSSVPHPIGIYSTNVSLQSLIFKQPVRF